MLYFQFEIEPLRFEERSGLRNTGYWGNVWLTMFKRCMVFPSRRELLVPSRRSRLSPPRLWYGFSFQSLRNIAIQSQDTTGYILESRTNRPLASSVQRGTDLLKISRITFRAKVLTEYLLLGHQRRSSGPPVEQEGVGVRHQGRSLQTSRPNLPTT